MARRIPKYRRHNGSSQALVQIDGRRIYLGTYDSPESRQAYDRVIAEWLAASRRNMPEKQKSPLRVNRGPTASCCGCTGDLRWVTVPDIFPGICAALGGDLQ